MPFITIVMRDALRSDKSTCAILCGQEFYWPLTQYFRERNFSVESERGYAYAVCKLMSWLDAKHGGESKFTKEMFSSFLHDLQSGTIKGEEDPSGLWWLPNRIANVKLTSQRISEFSDWLAVELGATSINPTDRLPSHTDKIIAWHHFAYKKKASFMAHLQGSAASQAISSKSRRVAVMPDKNSSLSAVLAFPTESIDDLLWKGFENKTQSVSDKAWLRWNLRDILITVLCLYGGVRESEALHLWVDDVYDDPQDPNSCQVLIHEPEEGLVDFVDPVTGRASSTSRLDYLNRFCGGKRPLTMETGRRHAGWKGSLLTDRKRRAFHVFWIDAEAGRLFRRIWAIYILQVRAIQPKTPWAFLTQDGLPMGTASFMDSFKAAVERIGLASSKGNGTTPHALRHRYGQWLNDLGISEKHGQVCMHHRSVSSQEVYRQMSAATVANVMALAGSTQPKMVQIPQRAWSASGDINES